LPDRFTQLDRTLARLHLGQSQSLWEPSFVELLRLFPHYKTLEVDTVIGATNRISPTRYPSAELITSCTLLVFASRVKEIYYLPRLTSLKTFTIHLTKSAEGFDFDKLLSHDGIPNRLNLTKLAYTKRATVARQGIPDSFFELKTHLPSVKVLELSDSYGDQVQREELRTILHHQGIEVDIQETIY